MLFRSSADLKHFRVCVFVLRDFNSRAEENKMQDFAAKLYNSKAWQRCRDNYKKSVGGLCERCLKNGKFVPAEIVHHKKHLTRRNINNPEIALGFGNLEALCRECHALEHARRGQRYLVDSLGRVTILPDNET